MNALRDFVWWVLLGTVGLVFIAAMGLGFAGLVNHDGGQVVIAVVIGVLDYGALKLIEPGRGMW